MSSKNNWQDKFLQKKLTKFVKVQVSRICLNQIRSNTYKQSIEKKKVTQNILVKNAFLVRLRISLLIFMRIAAERDNLMRLYGCSISYTWPLPPPPPSLLPIWVFLDWILKILFSYLKSASSNLPDCKISSQSENPSICDQKCLIWVFLDWNSKKVLSYLKSTPSSFPKSKFSCKNKNP